MPFWWEHEYEIRELFMQKVSVLVQREKEKKKKKEGEREREI
jgi:hypothetical protein